MMAPRAFSESSEVLIIENKSDTIKERSMKCNIICKYGYILIEVYNLVFI